MLKVESPTRPDGMRFATVKPPTDPDWMEFGPTFHGTNPAKRSVTIDFSTPEGRELVLRLVEHVDVVVENFTPRVLGNVGLEYHDLFARNPAVILLRMPAFGLDGPWRDRPGFAQTTEQVSGIAWMTGEAGGEALVRSTIDPIAGIHGAFAVLAALEHRDRTGEGQLDRDADGRGGAERRRRADRHVVGVRDAARARRQPRARRARRRACTRARATSSGSRCRSPTDDEWRALVGVLGEPEWATRPTTWRPAPAVGPRHDDDRRRARPRGSPGATATTPSTRCSPRACWPRRCGTR